jgi:hypothetical protein
MECAAHKTEFNSSAYLRAGYAVVLARPWNLCIELLPAGGTTSQYEAMMVVVVVVLLLLLLLLLPSSCACRAVFMLRQS